VATGNISAYLPLLEYMLVIIWLCVTFHNPEKRIFTVMQTSDVKT
jgi:hypothetical protein